MALYVASSFNSLVAQNALTANATSLSTSEQRLSTGLRINSAGDDAAGLAISTRLTNQISGLNQAALNANNGVSLAQVAQGALQQVTANLQRIRTLAVESANSTNSASDRVAIDQEVQQRIAEIQRLATQTSFNGTNLLDGTFAGAAFQVGANVGQTISLGNTSQNVQTSSLGAYAAFNGQTASSASTAGAYNVATAYTTQNQAAGIATAGNANTGTTQNAVDGNTLASTAANYLTINGTQINSSSSYATSVAGQDATSAYAKALAINSSGVNGVTATASTNLTFDPTATTVGAGNFLNVTAQGTGGGSGSYNYTLQINGTTVISTSIADVTGSTYSLSNAVAAINSYSSTTGVTAQVNTNGTLVLSAADGRNIQTTESLSGGTSTAAATVAGALTNFTSGAAVFAATNTATYRGQISLESPTGISIAAHGTASLQNIGLATTTTAINTASSLSQQNVQTVTNSNNTIYSVDSALTSINAYNATWGAIQNRLTSAVNNIGTSVQNLTTANGRIVNADYAAESTNLATADVIQQASTSILAQANSQVQQVLKLLQ